MLAENKKRLSVGDKAPEFSVLSDEEKQVTLKKFLGKTIILYFYPKDDTPGCTTEACDFSSNYEKITKENAVVLGVSKDNASSHRAFKAKFNLPFLLLSDPDGKICEAYGTWGTKMNYGKAYEGIIRSTFVIDPKGVIKNAWYNVKATGHVATVLQALV